MMETWRRIEHWLEQHHEDLSEDLLTGASDGALDAAEEVVGRRLPADLRQSFRCHDGQDGLMPLFGEWEHFRLATLLRRWQTQHRLAEEGVFDGHDAIRADPGVRAAWWHAGWLPVAGDDSGNLLCVDLEPADGGGEGQILLVWHEQPVRPLVASSWSAYLERFAAELEAGLWQVDEETEYLVRSDR